MLAVNGVNAVKELQEQLAQKDNDLVLAGEIGSRLLEEKMQLETTLKAQSLKIKELSLEVQDLEFIVSQKDEDISELRKSLKKSLDLCLVKEKEIQNISNLKSSLDNSHLNSESCIAKLQKENSNLQKSVQVLLKEQDSILEKNNYFNGKIQNLEKYVQENARIKENQEVLIGKNQDLLKENQDLQVEIKDLQGKIKDLFKENEYLLCENNTQMENSSEKEENVYGSFGSSLLNEIDEKRIQAEIEAKSSTEKHQGLLKHYHLVSRQKERMKNHISRLTQLSQKQSVEHRLIILERELSQALSENQILKGKLLSSRSSSDEDSLDLKEETLLSKVLQENNQLNQEIKTLHMLKLNEADKVRTAYSLLHVKEQELDSLRTQFAQIKFDLDEAQLKLNNPDVFQTDLNENTQILVEEIEQVNSDNPKVLESPDTNAQAPLEVGESVRNTSFHSSFGSDEEIQKVIQSLSGVSTPSSDSEVPLTKEESVNPVQHLAPQSRNIKVDRAKIGQDCNQQ